MSPDEAKPCGGCRAEWFGDVRCHSADCPLWPMIRGHERRPLKATAQAVQVATGGAPPLTPEGIESDARRLMQAAIRYGQLVAIGRVLRDMDRDAASQGSFHERDEINLTARASAEAMSHCFTLMAKFQSDGAAPSPTPEGIDDPFHRLRAAEGQALIDQANAERDAAIARRNEMDAARSLAVHKLDRVRYVVEQFGLSCNPPDAHEAVSNALHALRSRAEAAEKERDEAKRA